MEGPTVFVTVGTTRFDALVNTISSLPLLSHLRANGFRRVILQHGNSPLPELPALPSLSITTYTFKPSLADDLAAADLVISHAGSGSILEALDMGKKLLVVVNETLMDNHQMELAEALAEEGVLAWSTVEGMLDKVKDCALEGCKPYEKGNPDVFINLLRKKLGIDKSLSTRPTQTTQAIPTQAQSLNLVRNLLGTTIGAITYLRMLFPEENFKDTSLNGMALKSLVRDYSIEADELMDWLEKGCYDALEKQYLKTMIFGIYLDPDNPDKLVESYTFQFSYPEKDLWCVTIDAAGKETFRLKTRNEIMSATAVMLRRLLILTQTLKPLPENAYVTMKLYYYDEVTPLDYEPPFFQAGDDTKKFYFETKPEKIKIGQVDTPHHAVNLQVQTASDGIQPTRDDVNAMEVDSEQSEEKSYFAGEAWDDDPAEESAEKIPDQPAGPVNDVADEMKRLNLDEKDTGESVSDNMNDAPADSVHSDAFPLQNSQNSISHMDVSNSTPAAVDPGDNTQDLIEELREGAGMAPSAPPSSQASDQIMLDSAPRLDPPVPLANEESDTPILDENDRLQLHTGRSSRASTEGNQSRPAQAQQKVDQAKPLATEKSVTSPKEKESGDHEDEDLVYGCPCGVQESDGDLVECEECKTWGHIVCFGYTSMSDPRVPEHHYCYACLNKLFPGNGPYDLDRAAEVAIFRRGLFVVWDEGFQGASWFAERLGTGLPVASQLMNRLKKEGFLLQKKSRGRKVKGWVPYQYTVVKNEKQQVEYQKWFSEQVLPRSNGANKEVSMPRVHESLPSSQDGGQSDSPSFGLSQTSSSMTVDSEGGAGANPEAATTNAMKRKFLDRFEAPIERQTTGFVASQTTIPDLPLNSQMRHKAQSIPKRRKVSIVTKGIAVL
ncbi:DNA binding protein [Borealophlyctis nickersoniae]|nr:DNA binding protein [Borealophlyctis nickersoniae]